ncbi:MAG: ribokinase [Planctomycetaceae bacterium]
MNGPRSILVVGSINMDLVVQSARLPTPGETLIGRSISEIPGGKGANQAVGAARLGANVSMIGRIGDDAFGGRLLDGLKSAGIDTGGVRSTEGSSSGIAIIGVEDSGQNCITVIPGANGLVTPEDVSAAEALFSAADVLLLQLEIPLATVRAAIELAKRHGVLTVLDPAPAVTDLPPEMLEVDVVCPNESEASLLTGIGVSSRTAAEKAALALQQRGATRAIITLGDQGAVFCDKNGECGFVDGFSVHAVDTTAAGDAFAAALGLKLAEAADFRDAVRFACAAGAVAATREGAQPGMPSRDDVEKLV